MVDFAKIIEIRDRKVNDFRKKEKAALAECERARVGIQVAKKAMDEFAERIRTLEVDLIKDLLETEITISDIDELKHKLKAAEDKAKRLVREHKQAEDNLEQAEKNVEMLRAERVQAQSKLNKITELDTVLKEERKELAIAEEDAQMDAFVETMRLKSGAF